MTIAPNDSTLLRRFVRDGCEASFTELVRTHQSLVIGTALRRRGMAVPTTTLLASATALQTTAPAQAGLAAAALSTSGVAAPAALAFTTIMSHTAVKIAAAAIVLSAVPVVFTYQTNTRLHAEHTRTTPAIPLPRSATAAPANTDLTAINHEIAATWEQVRAEQTRRLAAEDKVAALRPRHGANDTPAFPWHTAALTRKGVAAGSQAAHCSPLEFTHVFRSWLARIFISVRAAPPRC